MEVPPFHVLHFADVTCSFQNSGSHVLCSGALVKPNGNGYPLRTSVLFRSPGHVGGTLIPICNQGGYGVTPKLNIFCAQ